MALLQAGLDSLGAVELRNAIAARFNISLPATATIDYPTAAALAKFVVDRMTPATRTAVPLQVQPPVVDMAAMERQVQQMVKNITGTQISPQQPLMEVCNPNALKLRLSHFLLIGSAWADDLKATGHVLTLDRLWC